MRFKAIDFFEVLNRARPFDVAVVDSSGLSRICAPAPAVCTMMMGQDAIALLLLVVSFTSALPWREPVGRKSSLSSASTLKTAVCTRCSRSTRQMLGGDAHRSVSNLSTRATSLLTSDRIDRIAIVELYEIVIELVGLRKIDARRALLKKNRFAATKRSFSGEVAMHFTMTQKSI